MKAASDGRLGEIPSLRREFLKSLSGRLAVLAQRYTLRPNAR